MINPQTSIAIEDEARKLLRNLEGNNGRAMRRFLVRVLVDGQVQQRFTNEGEAPAAAEFKLLKLYAKDRLDHNVEYETPVFIAACTTHADAKTGVVENRYLVECDVATASVRQLRLAVTRVMEVCVSMRRFVTNKDEVLYEFTPAAKRERERTARQLDAATTTRVLQLLSTGALRQA